MLCLLLSAALLPPAAETPAPVAMVLTSKGSVTPAEAAKRVGDKVTVEFQVKSAGSNPDGFLELYSEPSWQTAGCFFIRFSEATQAKFKKQKIPDVRQHFAEKVVRLTGEVKMLTFTVGTWPVIYIEDVGQIDIVPGGEKLPERDQLFQRADQLIQEGKRGEAIPHVEKALAIERDVPTGIRSAGWLNWLAGSYEERADFAAARKVRQEVFDIETQRWGAGHWRVTDARLALADVDALNRLTAEQRRRLEESDRLHNQALALANQGKYVEAIPPAVKALEIGKELLGTEYPRVLTRMNNLGWLYRNAGQEAQAEPLLREALRLRGKVLGEGHPQYAYSCNALGWLHVRRQQWDEAERCFR